MLGITAARNSTQYNGSAWRDLKTADMAGGDKLLNARLEGTLTIIGFNPESKMLLHVTPSSAAGSK